MTDPTRTRAEAIVNKFIMDTKDNSYTVIEGDDASELVIMLTQALDAERKAALEEAATECRQRAYAVTMNEPLSLNHLAQFLWWLEQRAQAGREGGEERSAGRLK